MNYAQILGYTAEQLQAIAHLGYHFFMEGKNCDAQILFEGLSVLDPENDYYRRVLGSIFYRQGSYDLALIHFNAATTINPSSPYAWINRAEIYLALGLYREAEADLATSIDGIKGQHPQLLQKVTALLQMVRSTVKNNIN